MANRREFLNAAAATAWATTLTSAQATAKDEPKSKYPPTWMNLAVNIEMTWGKMPVLDKIRKVADFGFTQYEFWPWRGKDIDAIAKLNDKLGLKTSQFSCHWGITSPEKRAGFLDDVKKAVEVAKILNVHKTCVVAGEMTKGLSLEAQNQAVVDSLKAAAEIVSPADVTIILEPLNVLVDHPHQLIVHSAHAAEILKAVGSSHVKMLFDCYHQQISEGNLSGNIRKYHDLIGYYQIGDHPGRHEPGTGEVNYAHVFRVIREVGYDGAIGMEFSPKSSPEAAFEAVRAFDRAAREGKPCA